MNQILVKKKKKHLKKAATGFLFFVFLCLILMAAGHKAWIMWKESMQKSDSPLAFKPETYTTNMPEFAADLDVFFASFKQSAFSSQEAKEKYRKFMDSHKEIKSMELLPSYLTGDLNIRLEARRAVSEVNINGKKKYLAEDGTIMDKVGGSLKPMPFSVHLSTPEISEYLPRFIEQLGAKQNVMAKPVRQISCGSGEESCVLELKDGTKVDWGTIFYTSRKIEELNHILKIAGKEKNSSSAGSLYVDMRYCVSSGRSFFKRRTENTASGNGTIGHS